MTAKFKNILLTGDPGIGKTTIIQKVLGGLASQAGGFFTQEIKSGKTQKGFDLFTLDGGQGVLAHINQKSSYKVGKYGVDLNIMTSLAVPALRAALDSRELIIIDEIGKMESFSVEFRDIVSRCLDSKKPVLGSIQNFASPFINAISNRNDIVRIAVTLDNRERLPEKIIELFQHLIPGKPAKRSKK